MKTWIMTQLVVSLLLVAGCSKGTNEGANNLREQLTGKTFQAQGLDQVSNSISDCGSGGTQPVSYSPGNTEPDQAGGDAADGSSIEGDYTEDIAQDNTNYADDLWAPASSALMRASHESIPQVTFTENKVSVGDESYEWKAVDGDTIEVKIEGTEVLIDVQIDGSTLIVSLSPDFSCSGGEGVPAQHSAPANEAPTVGSETEPFTAGSSDSSASEGGSTDLIPVPMP